MSTHDHTSDQESKDANKTNESNAGSFADRVGKQQRVSVPDPFAIATDAAAGVRLMESKQDGQIAIKFGAGGPEDKPSSEVLEKLRDAGYRWNSFDKIWAHPVTEEKAMTIRIEAQRLFDELSQMVRKDKGIEASQGVPF